MTDQTTEPLAALADVIKDMQSRTNTHLCSSCDLSDEERAEIEGRRHMAFKYAPKLEAILRALRLERDLG